MCYVLLESAAYSDEVFGKHTLVNQSIDIAMTSQCVSRANLEINVKI
jgi:hypothetical protein